MYILFSDNFAIAWYSNDRLNELFTLFYMHNLVQTFSSAETRLETLNSQSFVDFDEN